MVSMFQSLLNVISDAYFKYQSSINLRTSTPMRCRAASYGGGTLQLRFTERLSKLL